MDARILARVLMRGAWAIVIGNFMWIFLVGPPQQGAMVWVPLLWLSLGVQIGLAPWLMTRHWHF